MSYIYNLTDTWNAGGTAFDGIKMAITNTASAAGSYMLNLSTSGATTGSFTVDKSGNMAGSGGLTLGTALGVASGGTGATAFTAGSVVFAGAAGVYTQNNSALFWDNTNARLGIGFAAPAQKLDVAGTIRVNEDAAGTKIIQIRSNYASTGPAIQVTTNDPLNIITNNSIKLTVDNLGNVFGTGGSTSMTGGFIMIPAAYGTPTGVPTSGGWSAVAPMYYDRTNELLYVYNAGWKKSSVFT